MHSRKKHFIRQCPPKKFFFHSSSFVSTGCPKPTPILSIWAACSSARSLRSSCMCSIRSCTSAMRSECSSACCCTASLILRNRHSASVSPSINPRPTSPSTPSSPRLFIPLPSLFPPLIPWLQAFAWFLSIPVDCPPPVCSVLVAFWNRTKNKHYKSMKYARWLIRKFVKTRTFANFNDYERQLKWIADV